MNMWPGLWVIMNEGLRGQRHRLRRDAAGPEHRHVARANPCAVAPVGLVDVLDAERGRVADVHRGAVGVREARAGGHRLGERARTGSGRIETTMGPWKAPAGRHSTEVCHIATFLPCSTWHSGMPASSSAHSKVNEQPSRNATRSSRQNGRRVGDLVGEHAVLVDAIARDVRAQIGARRHPHRLGRAHVGHLDERARPRVALAEEQEVVGLLPRQHREVGLHEAGGRARR